MTDEILARRRGAAGHISLNRPRAINALTRPMCAGMTEALLGWQSDAAVQAVLIDHAPAPEGAERPSRGFCAGGDVTMVRQSALEDGGKAGRDFFFTEYRLNHLLFTYPKPVVAFMDGITMGGGVGISQPATFRVATENTLFAMPEKSIGLFPDVGGGWYLARLPGQVGKFLALTGARLDGAECMAVGLATHYLPSAALAEAKERIAAAPGEIAAILDELSVEPPAARLAGNLDRIDRLFAPDRLEAIIAALQADPSDWAAKELKAVTSGCPATAKVSLRQIAEGAGMADFAAEMTSEYRIAARMIMRPDFAEGVRAVLIDKDNAPAWSPATADGVTTEMLDAIFAPLAAGEEWSPL